MTTLELDSREIGEFTVTLLWNKETNTIEIEIREQGVVTDSFPVPRGEAREAFLHPFGYVKEKVS